MDRVAALADIVPPSPPAAVAVAPWWQHPAVALVLIVAVALLAAAWARRSRRWRRLRASVRGACRAGGGAVPDRAVALAAALRAALPEADWPQALRGALDRLRYASAAEPQASRRLAALSATVDSAATRAIAASALSPRRARAAFLRRCAAPTGVDS